MPKGKSRAAYRNTPYNIPADERELAYQEYQVQRYKENLEAAKKLPEFLTAAKLKLFHVNAHMSLLDFAKVASKFRLDANRFKNSMAEPTRYMELQVNDIREMFPLELVSIPSKAETSQKINRKRLHDCTGNYIHDFLGVLDACGLITKKLGEKKHLRMYEYVYDPALLVTYLSKIEVAEPTQEEFWHAWKPNTKRKIDAVKDRMHAWKCAVCTDMLAIQKERECKAEEIAAALLKARNREIEAEAASRCEYPNLKVSDDAAKVILKEHARGAQLASKSRDFYAGVVISSLPPVEKVLDIPPALYESVAVASVEEATGSQLEQILGNQKLILSNLNDIKEAVAHAFYGSGPHPSWIKLPSKPPDTL